MAPKGKMIENGWKWDWRWLKSNYGGCWCVFRSTFKISQDCTGAWKIMKVYESSSSIFAIPSFSIPFTFVRSLASAVVQKDTTEQSEVLQEWRPDEDSSYCCLLSQHTHLQRLSSSLFMVVLSSFDRMTSLQLCISLLTDKEFVDLRGSWEGEVVILSIVGLVILYMVAGRWFSYCRPFLSFFIVFDFLLAESFHLMTQNPDSAWPTMASGHLAVDLLGSCQRSRSHRHRLRGRSGLAHRGSQRHVLRAAREWSLGLQLGRASLPSLPSVICFSMFFIVFPFSKRCCKMFQVLKALISGYQITIDDID